MDSSTSFRPNASTQEKLYIVGTVLWMVLAVAGFEYTSYALAFEPERDVLPPFFVIGLLCAFLHCMPLFLDRHPSNRAHTLSLPKRLAAYGVVLLVSLMFVWFTFLGIVGPIVTRSFGSSMSGEFVVIHKSRGDRDRSGCDHYVRLKDMNSEWTVKVCLDEEVWASLQESQIVGGSGRRSVLGRTIEQLTVR